MAVFFAAHSLMAMQPPQEAPKLIIVNTTRWPVLAKYTVPGKGDPRGVALERVVPAKATQTITDPEKITSLKIEPYGEVWGSVNIEKVSKGLVELPDHTQAIDAALESAKADVKLTISLPEGWKGIFSAFDIKVTRLEERLTTMSEEKLLMNVFPAIKNILQPLKMGASGTIEARHFLDLPKDANEDSFNAALKQKREELEQMTLSQAYAIRNMGGDALDFLKLVEPIMRREFAIKAEQAKLAEDKAKLDALVKQKLLVFDIYGAKP